MGTHGQSSQTNMLRSEVLYSPQAALGDSGGAICPPLCPALTVAPAVSQKPPRAQSTQCPSRPSCSWRPISCSSIQRPFVEGPAPCKPLGSSIRDVMEPLGSSVRDVKILLDPSRPALCSQEPEKMLLADG